MCNIKIQEPLNDAVLCPSVNVGFEFEIPVLPPVSCAKTPSEIERNKSFLESGCVKD